jgi:hypothetical protein
MKIGFGLVGSSEEVVCGRCLKLKVRLLSRVRISYENKTDIEGNK